MFAQTTAFATTLEASLARNTNQPPTHQEEEKRKSAMTKDHRFFHRRQAASPTKVLTVNVEVIATVDSGGNLVAQETKTRSCSRGGHQYRFFDSFSCTNKYVGEQHQPIILAVSIIDPGVEFYHPKYVTPFIECVLNVRKQ
ncbi:hypothetical protein SNOG_11682 [Parastagonospora nodorum SN15]|uniref:Uncharacterized protein n=1 Tax=Phaeosphaeria nodorum (strain SN15 / ATCC MYA-4574 / FGSC 10173) TaxID=321614 RepID=Q0U982_PHANO|nr:hypothetical protein SNOG_11682 [Parastagonospora nodorum SN15]EAT80726.2 hypothetical protein SNOG_11682 [Parastagonospora nodorum SN15]